MSLYYYTTSEHAIEWSNSICACCVLLFGESCFFLFFVGDFLFEQMEAIETNSTLVETYQQKRGRQDGLMTHLYDVMGPTVAMWWIPMANPKKVDLHEPIFLDKGKEDEVVDTDEIGILPTESSVRVVWKSELYQTDFQ